MFGIVALVRCSGSSTSEMFEIVASEMFGIVALVRCSG